ncbi:MAG: PTS sugar transporter subunit IIA, partial [Candidatus Omnitrophica bacterium]|nr:PTS sugar transporter subunit IIA [Candidatus Omnitrophota bacterium]
YDLDIKEVSKKEKVQAVIDNYQIGAQSFSEVKIEELPGGIALRRPLRIITPLGDFALKYAAKNRRKADFVVSLIEESVRQNLPVPHLYHTKNNKKYLQIGNNFYYLEDFISEGKELKLSEASFKHFVALGKVMALFHNRLEGFRPKGKKKELSAVNITTAEADISKLRSSFVSSGGSNLPAEELFIKYEDFIIEQFINLRKSLLFTKYDSLPKSLIHGDLSVNNVKWSNSELIALFDWERSRKQARIEEFKNALLSAGAEVGREYDRERLVGLLKGYQLISLQKFLREELQALPYLLGPATFLWDIAKWFVLAKESIDGDSQKYQLVEKLLAEFQNVVEDFNKNWWYNQKGKILGDDIKEILKLTTPHSRKDRLIEYLKKADSMDSQLAIMHLSLESTYLDPEIKLAVSEGDKCALLSKALSLLLQRKDSQQIAEFLDSFLRDQSSLITPEAKFFIQSYLNFYKINKSLNFAVCISLYDGQQKYPPSPAGKDWLRTNVDQLFYELAPVNPKVKPSLVFVSDGDDSNQLGQKTSDVIKELLKDDYYFEVKDKISILSLSNQDKLKMHSKKHGALACGMRFALDKENDVVTYTDGDPSMHLGLFGLLLGSITLSGNDLAFGSIRKKSAIHYDRKWFRILGSLAYNWWVKICIKYLRGIKDTQRSFKAFKAEVLEQIIPVEIKSIDKDGNLDISFDQDFFYDFTGDGEWLGRANILGFSQEEVPTVWIDNPKTSTIRVWGGALPMFLATLKQRKTLGKYAEKVIDHASEGASRSEVEKDINIFKIKVSDARIDKGLEDYKKIHQGMPKFKEAVEVRFFIASNQAKHRAFWFDSYQAITLSEQIRKVSIYLKEDATSSDVTHELFAALDYFPHKTNLLLASESLPLFLKKIIFKKAKLKKYKDPLDYASEINLPSDKEGMTSSVVGGVSSLAAVPYKETKKEDKQLLLFPENFENKGQGDKEEVTSSVAGGVSSPAPDSSNASFGKGVLRKHHQVDSIIRIFPKKIVKKGDRDYDFSEEKKLMSDRNGGDSLSVDKNQQRRSKIDKAISLLEQIHPERAEHFKKHTTVISIDLPSPFLLYGQDNKGESYYQLTHLGRSRNRIYISGYLLDLITDPCILAAILNHDQYELDIYCKHQGDNFVINPKSEEEIHQEAMGSDPFKKYNSLFELIDYWSKRLEGNQVFTDKIVKEKIESIDSNINHLKNKIKKEKLGEDSNLRFSYSQLAHLFFKKGLFYESCGRRGDAVGQFRLALYNLENAEKADQCGLFPIQIQEQIVYLLALEGLVEELERELSQLLNFTFKKNIASEDLKNYDLYLQSKFPFIKESLISILERYHANEDNKAKKEKIREVVERIKEKKYKQNGLNEKDKSQEASKEKIAQIVEKDHFIDINGPLSWDEALKLVAEKASQEIDIDSGELLDKFIEREEEGSTAMDKGIAIPHIIVNDLDQYEIFLFRCKEGISWPNSKEPIKVMFALIGPRKTKEQKSYHLKVMSKIAQLSVEPDFGEKIDKLMEEKDSDEKNMSEFGLHKKLKETNHSFRGLVVKNYAEENQKKAVPVFFDLLEHINDNRLRKTILIEIGKLSGQNQLGKIKSFIYHGTANDALAAVEAISYIEGRRSAEVLIKADKRIRKENIFTDKVENPEAFLSSFRQALLKSLGQTGFTEAREYLIEILESKGPSDQDFRRDAASGLGNKKFLEAATNLAKYSQDESFWVAYNSIKSLRLIVDNYLKYLKDQNLLPEPWGENSEAAQLARIFFKQFAEESNIESIKDINQLLEKKIKLNIYVSKDFFLPGYWQIRKIKEEERQKLELNIFIKEGENVSEVTVHEIAAALSTEVKTPFSHLTNQQISEHFYNWTTSGSIDSYQYSQKAQEEMKGQNKGKEDPTYLPTSRDFDSHRVGGKWLGWLKSWLIAGKVH